MLLMPPEVVKPARVAVASVTTVCPDPGGAKVSTLTPPGGTGQGRATVSEVAGAPRQDAKPQERGERR